MASWNIFSLTLWFKALLLTSLEEATSYLYKYGSCWLKAHRIQKSERSKVSVICIYIKKQTFCHCVLRFSGYYQSANALIIIHTLKRMIHRSWCMIIAGRALSLSFLFSQPQATHDKQSTQTLHYQDKCYKSNVPSRLSLW